MSLGKIFKLGNTDGGKTNNSEVVEIFNDQDETTEYFEFTTDNILVKTKNEMPLENLGSSKISNNFDYRDDRIYATFIPDIIVSSQRAENEVVNISFDSSEGENKNLRVSNNHTTSEDFKSLEVTENPKLDIEAIVPFTENTVADVYVSEKGTEVPGTLLLTEIANPIVVNTGMPVITDAFTENFADLVVSFTEETAHPATEVIEKTTTYVTVTEGTTEMADTFVPITEEATEMTDTFVPITEEATEMTDTFVPITEETTEMADTFVPVAEEATEMANTFVPITEEALEMADTFVPITEATEMADTFVPITEETTIIVPVTEDATEISDNVVPVTEESTFILPLTAETMETVIPVTEEALETAIPVTEETVQDIETAETVLATEETTETNVHVIERSNATILSNSQETLDGFSVDTKTVIPVIEGSIVTMNSTESAGKRDVVLEASPRMEVTQGMVVGPLEPVSFDVKIKTIKDLRVDVHDAVFDPSQVAKATSYEESSHSTATRSATVTTWVDPNNTGQNFLNQGYANLTNLREVNVNLKQSLQVNKDSLSMSPSHDNGSNKQIMEAIANSLPVTTPTDTSNSGPLDGVDIPEAITVKGNVYNEHAKKSEAERDNTQVHERIATKLFESGTPQIPLLKLNAGESEDVSGTPPTYAKDNNKTEDQFIYEMPEINRSSGPHLTSSIVIALSVCFSVIVLISILTVSLWLCRRHKNRSKIYLTREAAKPRAFFTKPMNPALLPNERLDVADSMYVLEFQKPRAPVVLSDDPECVVIGGQVILESQIEESAGGMENPGFVDIPLEEIKPKNYSKDNKNHGHNPPKLGSKSRFESDTDSGIKVWSSTGSLYTASPELSHCSIPPPPYSSSISKESVNLLMDALPSMGSKSRLLYV